MVERDDAQGYKVKKKQESRPESGLPKRSSSKNLLGNNSQEAGVRSQDEMSPEGNSVRQEFRPFMPKLGTDERSAMQRLDTKFREMEQVRVQRERNQRKDLEESERVEEERDLKERVSETTSEKHIKAKIYGSKFGDNKNYNYIDGNRNLRFEKVVGLEKEGLSPEELMERKRRILTMKEALSEGEQESLNNELEAIEGPLTTDENFETPGREER